MKKSIVYDEVGLLSRGSKDTLVKYVNTAWLFDSSFYSYSLSGKDKCKVIYFGLE